MTEWTMRAAQDGKARILIATDDAITREILVQLLRMAGHEAVPAATGEQALFILRDEGRRIDALVTDVQLPRLVDGWMLADEFRSLHRARPIVFASAQESDLAREIEGAVFIKKPMSPPEMLATLQRLYGTEEAAVAAPAAASLPAPEQETVVRHEKVA